MGRHSAPEPVSGPSIGRVLLLTVLLAAVVVAGSVYLFGGDGDVTTTAGGGSSVSSTGASGSQAPPSGSDPPGGSGEQSTSPSPASPSKAATKAATKTPDTRQKRSPTLRLDLVGTSYVTVRVPGGRTLTSKTYRKGARLRYDRARLEVVLGNAGAVKVVVNGKERKRGERGQVATFTVRRR